MTGRLSTVERGRHIDTTDLALRNPSERLLRSLETIPLGDFTDFGRKELGLSKDPRDIHHVEEEFLGDATPSASFPPNSKIPGTAQKQAILHSAYIQALRVALYKDPDAKRPTPRKPALPIVSYWISGVPHYEVYVTLSSTDQEVHVMIMTPTSKTPVKPNNLGGRHENIWALGTDDRIDELRNQFPDGWSKYDVIDIKGTRCQKLMSYDARKPSSPPA
jgi:hypothetical protein